MKWLTLSFCLFLGSFSVFAQESTNAGEANSEKVFRVVEQMPEFPGGMKALIEFMRTNIRYSSSGMENDIQGRVIVEFIVDKSGELRDFKVVRSIDPYLDAEAIRFCKSMPKWNPGKQRGKAVNVKYTLPILFKL